MEQFQLQVGDVFCTANPWMIGRLILAGERLWSHDGAAFFGHAGIVVGKYGRTMEVLWKVEYGHLDTYCGKPMLIARPKETVDGMPVTAGAVKLALQVIQSQHLGRPYPLWRLFLHLVPPLARRISSGKHAVCSELTAKYLMLISARGMTWQGATPDMLADEWDKWKNFEIVYDGIWPANNL